MKRGHAAQYLLIIPLAFFLALAGVFSASPSSPVFEPPLLLPILSTLFLAILPLTVAFLAAGTYVLQGSPAFLLFGCGMVVFGLGSLFAGWGLPFYGQNFAVTVHNVGSLLGGLCHLGAVAFLILRLPVGSAKTTRRYSSFRARVRRPSASRCWRPP